MNPITVSYLGKAEKIIPEKGLTIEKLLEKLKINLETVIVKLNGEIIPDDEKVKPGDRVEIIKVVSGG